ncbi:MAG: TAXI family TRAP transporter solute-binding subunit [Syntrophorhabdaceae bacterium]|nr:TAXI family TRAP transporter solute-binding subunit [Syntrophorhabdaceae bacterium]MDD5242796.1 TAXI family TRAP transporter solute-binding subunit [Syntrophorhabdaceae bacterium]
MKKVSCTFINVCLIFVIGFLFLGAAPEKPKPDKDWPKTYAIGSGTGSVYYAIAGGIGAISEKYLGIAGIPSKTSGAEETARLLHRNEIQFGFITPDVGSDCVRGIGNFKKTGRLNVRVILQDFPLGYTITTLEGKGINSPSDLKGKAGHIGGRASPICRTFFKETLQAYGMKAEDLKASLPHDTVTEAIEALIVGKVDFFIDPTPHPSAKWAELAATHPMKIVNVDDEHMKKMVKNVPYMFPMKIPGGTYKTMPKDVTVSAFSSIVCGNGDLPDRFVYELTKAVWTHFDEFKTYHSGAKYFSTESVKRINYMPYHPGAIKYYKEIGVWTKELDERQNKLLAEIGAKR